MTPYYLTVCAIAAVLAATIWLPWRTRRPRRRLRAVLTAPLMLALIAALWVLHDASDIDEEIAAGISHMNMH